MSEIFGGMEPSALAEALGGGFATWVDTDAADQRIVTAQGAMIVHAPIETAYLAVSDFEGLHRFMGVSRPAQIVKRTGDELVVKLKQGIGLGPFSVGLSQQFRFRLRRPHGVDCLEYLDGPFKTATLSWSLHALDDARTLLQMTFIADLTELGGLIQKFFDKQPEIAFAASANVVIVPMLAYVQEAERRAHGRIMPRPPSPPIAELVTSGHLEAPLRRGYLTVGMLDPAGMLMDVASLVRVGASIEQVWPAIEDPAVLQRVISFVTGGRVQRMPASQLHQELEYTIRFGFLKKRYKYARLAVGDRPHSVRTIRADLDGIPVVQTEHLWPSEGGTTVCHMARMDLKQDWFANLFLRQHPEFECLIGTYSPAVFVRSVRLLHGRPHPPAPSPV